MVGVNYFLSIYLFSLACLNSNYQNPLIALQLKCEWLIYKPVFPKTLLDSLIRDSRWKAIYIRAVYSSLTGTSRDNVILLSKRRQNAVIFASSGRCYPQSSLITIWTGGHIWDLIGYDTHVIPHVHNWKCLCGQLIDRLLRYKFDTNMLDVINWWTSPFFWFKWWLLPVISLSGFFFFHSSWKYILSAMYADWDFSHFSLVVYYTLH